MLLHAQSSCASAVSNGWLTPHLRILNTFSQPSLELM